MKILKLKSTIYCKKMNLKKYFKFIYRRHNHDTPNVKKYPH